MISLIITTNLYGYYPLSPYSYCASNPTNFVDPTGKDICVLYYDDGKNIGHMAMLIQQEDGNWKYYSINGNNVYVSGYFYGGREFNDLAVGNWASPQDFLNSSYNSRTENSANDKSVSNFEYNEAYQIQTTPEQDAKIASKFEQISNSKYNIISNNCATSVQQVMLDAGLNISVKTENSFVPMSTPFGIVDVVSGVKTTITNELKTFPNAAFRSIIKANPCGTYYNKSHKR